MCSESSSELLRDTIVFRVKRLGLGPRVWASARSALPAARRPSPNSLRPLSCVSLSFCRLSLAGTMACRWGTETSVGRCHPLWMNFSNCVTSTETPSECLAFRDDYFECLHGNRQVRTLMACAPRVGRPDNAHLSDHTPRDHDGMRCFPLRRPFVSTRCRRSASVVLRRGFRCQPASMRTCRVESCRLVWDCERCGCHSWSSSCCATCLGMCQERTFRRAGT